MEGTALVHPVALAFERRDGCNGNSKDRRVVWLRLTDMKALKEEDDRLRSAHYHLRAQCESQKPDRAARNWTLNS